MTETPPALPSPTPPPIPVTPKTSGLAIASLVCALVPIPIISVILAVIFSNKAKQQIRESNGALTGMGLATAGMVISIITFVAIFVGSALFALAMPAILKQRKKMEMTRSISNGKQLYMVMLDYEDDMGSFPDDATAAEIENPDFYRGNSSNRYLAQLIAKGYTMNESNFSTGELGYTEADEIISPAAEILKKGENGWSYMLVDDRNEEPVIRGLSTADDGELPLLISPLTDISGNINPKPYDSRGVYLRVDGSARNERYGSSPKSPLDHPAWNEKFRPVVKMPE